MAEKQQGGRGRFRSAFWTANLLALLVASSSAQGQDVLSDNELFASYCVGHLNRVLENLQEIERTMGPCVEVPGGDCRGLNEAKQQAHEGIAADQSRLSRYLIARGIFTVRKSTLILAGLSAATRQGEMDTDVCFGYAREDCRGASNAGKCAEEVGKKRPECIQMNRCNDLSRIPF